MIGIGSDHGGFELKNQVKEYLQKQGKEILDFGVDSPESVDYPDIAERVCAKVVSGELDFAILMCGTGIGISIAANKVKGIRAALLSDGYSAKMAKEHNNANVICIGGRTIGPDLACFLVDQYMQAEFQGGRHQRRVDKIMNLEVNDETNR